MTATRREVIGGGALLAYVIFTTRSKAETIPPSPEWVRTMPSAPVPGTKITEEYAALVGRDAFFWAWPLVNVYSRRLVYEKATEIVLLEYPD